MQGQGPRNNGTSHNLQLPRQHYAANKRPSRYPRGDGEDDDDEERLEGPEGDEDISVMTNDTETHVSFYSDNVTTGSYMDNVSTTPLKSIGSTPSTKSPSVLSAAINNDNDNSLYVASTTETSITPTVTNNPQLSHNLSYPNSQLSNLISATGSGLGGPDRPVPQGGSVSISSAAAGGNTGTTTGGPVDRDSESIVTLASSSRRLRRRSLDTNCSTAGIPPASIMERLSVNPTAANSTYAVSMYDRGSVYNNDRGSLNDVASSEQTSEQMSREN